MLWSIPSSFSGRSSCIARAGELRGKDQVDQSRFLVLHTLQAMDLNCQGTVVSGGTAAKGMRILRGPEGQIDPGAAALSCLRRWQGAPPDGLTNLVTGFGHSRNVQCLGLCVMSYASTGSFSCSYVAVEGAGRVAAIREEAVPHRWSRYRAFRW